MLLIPMSGHASNEYLIIYAIPRPFLFLGLMFLIPITFIIHSRYRTEYFFEMRKRRRWHWILGLPLLFVILGVGLTAITSFVFAANDEDIVKAIIFNIVFSILVVGLLILDYRLVSRTFSKRVLDVLSRHDFDIGEFCVEDRHIKKDRELKTKACVSRKNDKYLMTLIKVVDGLEYRYSSESPSFNHVVAFFVRYSGRSYIVFQDDHKTESAS